MINKNLFVVVNFLFACSALIAGQFETIEEKYEWENRSFLELERIKNLPKEDSITELSDWVYKLNRQQKSPETNNVRIKATNLLTSIPGHAKYYQDKIESLRSEVISNSKKTEEELKAMQDYNIDIIGSEDYSSYAGATAFPTLSYMPSAETVAVLGHFLNDPEGRDGKNVLGKRVIRIDASPPTVNAEAATWAIRNLGIEHAPFPLTNRVGDRWVKDGEIDAWKDWWNEVAAGKRTYRFIGSSVEYGPDGPVSKDKLERIRQDRNRDTERGKAQLKPGKGTGANTTNAFSKPLPVAGILATLILAASGGWYFFKRRKAM